jgi:hypothetical protein
MEWTPFFGLTHGWWDPLEREEGILMECQDLLHDFLLQDQILDIWQWRPDPDHGYYVCDAYQLLTT